MFETDVFSIEPREPSFLHAYVPCLGDRFAMVPDFYSWTLPGTEGRWNIFSSILNDVRR